MKGANLLTRIGFVLVGIIVGAALLAPLIAPASPVMGDVEHAYLLPPSAEHWFGTDTQGRDILSRVIYGARISLGVGLIAQSVEMVRVKGTVLVLGLCTKPDTFVPFTALAKEARLQTSAFFTVEEYRASLDALNAGAAEPQLGHL